MKTLTKLATALPAFALISACSTTAPVPPVPTATETVTDPAATVPQPATDMDTAPTTPAPTTPPQQATPAAETTNVAYDRMAPTPYTCTDDSQILAKQSVNKNQAMLTATIPKINWSQQTIILNGGVEGETASYVNNANPEVIYAWHMQGNEGVFAMKWADGQEYQVDCEMPSL
ncbi:hypothetical protein [uncultured Psychrobacter sp.]|uniref:hypothetical protein n=1 Tax=uncultured Psychrobacter sp. TaxID=259303 RepID=UPI0034574890